MAVGGGCTFSSDDIVVKSPNDRRLYRYIVLPNGLCALLVHDPEICSDDDGAAGDSRSQDGSGMEVEDDDEDYQDEDEEDGEEDDDEEEEDSEEDGQEEEESNGRKGATEKKVNFHFLWLIVFVAIILI